ncbi:hypothetical protein GW933_01715 [Candidatus Falkowbacteria bacterium]|nr:hypothetical protein [Candidatus Falkowbacteria bacterium]
MESIVKCAQCDMPITDESKCKCDSNLCKDCCDCKKSEDSKCACGHDCGCK